MRGLITLLFFSVSMGLFSQPMFIAHRGASFLAPENTVSAANLAWESGAGAVEVDVYLTSDNRVMVIHDHDTRRTAGGSQGLVIRDTPSQALRELEVGSWKDEKYRGEKIPFLSEVIATVPEGKKLVVEIKSGREIMPHLKRVIEQSGKPDQMVFISFGWETMLDVREKFPDNRCYWLSSEREGLDQKMQEAVQARLDGVNLNYGIIDGEVMRMAEKNDLEVLTWTVNDPEIANKMIDLGVAGITTDRPKWLKKELQKPD